MFTWVTSKVEKPPPNKFYNFLKGKKKKNNINERLNIWYYQRNNVNEIIKIFKYKIKLSIY